MSAALKSMSAQPEGFEIMADILRVKMPVRAPDPLVILGHSTKHLTN